MTRARARVCPGVAKPLLVDETAEWLLIDEMAEWILVEVPVDKTAE